MASLSLKGGPAELGPSRRHLAMRRGAAGDLLLELVLGRGLALDRLRQSSSSSGSCTAEGGSSSSSSSSSGRFGASGRFGVAVPEPLDGAGAELLVLLLLGRGLSWAAGSAVAPRTRHRMPAPGLQRRVRAPIGRLLELVVRAQHADPASRRRPIDRSARLLDDMAELVGEGVLALAARRIPAVGAKRLRRCRRCTRGRRPLARIYWRPRRDGPGRTRDRPEPALHLGADVGRQRFATALPDDTTP